MGFKEKESLSSTRSIDSFEFQIEGEISPPERDSDLFSFLVPSQHIYRSCMACANFISFIYSHSAAREKEISYIHKNSWAKQPQSSWFFFLGDSWILF